MSTESFECEVMSWRLFDELSKKLAKKIITSGFQPDFLVGLARGGWVLSRVLCDHLGIKDLVSLKVEHWGVTATPDGSARIKYAFDIDLSGRKVLIVDDITDTGQSMELAVDYVKQKTPDEIKTAALRHIENSEFIPDYFAEEIKWRWVIFPWNYTEDMCNIIPKAAVGSKDASEIKRNLKNRFGIELTEDQIKNIQAEIRRRSNGD
jgi:hypothetical protein